MSGALEWFNDLLSKTDESDFETSSVPETFKVWLHEEDTVYAEWDLSKELRENGMAFKNYTNASLNVDVEFLFLHDDLADKFKDEESFQKILELTLNHSERTWKNVWNTTTTLTLEGGAVKLYYSIALGSVAMLFGLVGLIIKARGDSPTKVVKVTRICGSLMCILTALTTLLGEIMERKSIFDEGKVRHFSVNNESIFTGGVSNALVKAFLVSWKVFTLIIYIFQNIMLYRPFFFREHKKALGKWFLRVSLSQSVLIVTGSLVGAIVLISDTSDVCEDIKSRSKIWHITLLALGSAGFCGSLLLSFIFLVGYYRKNVKSMRRSEVKSIGKTMIACSIETLFDLAVVIIYLTDQVPCLSFSPFNYFKFGFAHQPIEASKCDMRFKWWALDSELSGCTMMVLLCQPVLQEAIYVLSELVAFCSKKKCWLSPSSRKPDVKQPHMTG